jgi:Holliday junction resolvase RusA-like endonuclease
VRFGKGGAYTDPKKKAYVNSIAAKVSVYSPSIRFTGSVYVGVIYCFGWRKSDKITDISIMRNMTARPDLDNLQKPLFDALSLGGMLEDDASIVRTSTMKVRWMYEGIMLKICSASANDYTLSLLDTSDHVT